MAHRTIVVNPRNKRELGRLRKMYTKQFGLLCESCEGDSFGRRTRCKKCRLLLCTTCHDKHRCKRRER